MIKKNILYFTILLWFLIPALALLAQNNNLAEKDLIKQANTTFNKKRWKEAIPLFAQLVSVYPDKADYNYKLGVSILLGDRSDRKMPIRYLKNAYPQMQQNETLLYYLGLAYYQNEEYENAIQFLEMFRSKTEPNSPEASEVFRIINACQNGVQLIHKNRIAEVITKNEFHENNYHRAYPVDEINGALIQKPENFLSSKKNENDFNKYVYISEVKGILYFSGYDSVSSQRDIFYVTYDEQGNWGKPKKVPGEVNSYYDEDYPVIADGGRIMYFCSKGHNSLGGYDIYRSYYDSISGTFNSPENMGSGINSPFDDILFIPDKTGEYAFFASNRNNLNDAIDVYKIRLLDEDQVQANMLASQLKADQQKNILLAEQSTTDEAGFATGNDPSVTAIEEHQTSKSDHSRTIHDEPERVVKEPPVRVYEQVTPVSSAGNIAFAEDKDEKLEINTEEHSQKNVPQESLNNSAVVQNKQQTVKIYDQVRPVNSAENLTFVDEDDENLEIQTEKLPQGTEIAFVEHETKTGSDMPDKTTAQPVDNMKIYQQVQEVDAENEMVAFEQPEEDLEIRNNNENDLVTKQEVSELTGAETPVIAGIVEPVQPPEKKQQVLFDEASSEIEVNADPSTEQAHQASKAAETNTQMLFGSLPFRNYDHQKEHCCITTANTDKSHAELVRAARSNPDSLSYEELLLAADLIPSPYEKLGLYRVAFIRIDRDWRAYYHASLVAREVIQKDEADVYRYQAHLINDQEMALLDIEILLEILLDNPQAINIAQN